MEYHLFGALENSEQNDTTAKTCHLLCIYKPVGILPKICLLLIARVTNNPIPTNAPTKAPLISTNVKAARADEFSIDSRPTSIYRFPR